MTKKPKSQLAKKFHFLECSRQEGYIRAINEKVGVTLPFAEKIKGRNPHLSTF